MGCPTRSSKPDRTSSHRAAVERRRPQEWLNHAVFTDCGRLFGLDRLRLRPALARGHGLPEGRHEQPDAMEILARHGADIRDGTRAGTGASGPPVDPATG